MFCIPGLIFGGIEGVSSPFHVLRSRARFRGYGGRPDSFSAVLMASGRFFIFCALEIIFGGFEGVGFRFNVLRSQTRFRRYRGRSVPFSNFALPDSFSSVTREWAPNFMFLALGVISYDTVGIGTRFRRY
jgi:hypothetical protein